MWRRMNFAREYSAPPVPGVALARTPLTDDTVAPRHGTTIFRCGAPLLCC